MDEARRVRHTLRGLLASHPYFGSLALRLPIMADPSRENIASDGQSLRFNPTWVAQNTADDIKVRIADVVLGCALKHHTRRGERDYGRWQQAHKEVTLPLLRDAGLTDEQGGRDMSIEECYQLIPEPPEQPQQQPGGQGEGSGESGGQGQPQPGQGDGQGNGQPDSQSAPGAGEMMDAPTPDDPAEQQAALKQAEQDWDKAGKQAVAMAKAEGRQPGSIAEMIANSHKAEKPWRDLLRDFMTSVAPRDYAWSRPNRRFAGRGIYLPSMTGEAMPPVVFAIDTSGSLDEQALAQLWSELCHACGEVEPEQITVIQCDSSISSVTDYHPSDLPDEIEITGRGGTRFSPVFAHMAERPDSPACLIYLTDGYCSDFGAAPDCPVIWAIEPAGMADFSPPFGEVIHLEEAA